METTYGFPPICFSLAYMSLTAYQGTRELGRHAAVELFNQYILISTGIGQYAEPSMMEAK